MLGVRCGICIDIIIIVYYELYVYNIIDIIIILVDAICYIARIGGNYNAR